MRVSAPAFNTKRPSDQRNMSACEDRFSGSSLRTLSLFEPIAATKHARQRSALKKRR
jgi:hypothetical protein